MKSMLVTLVLASLSLCACSLDGTAPTPLGSENSELNDPTCGALFQAYQACDAREARYDSNGKRIPQFVCVDESNAWAECMNPRHAPIDTDAAAPEAARELEDEALVGNMPVITVPR
ncbi:MAG: hypothetical protein ACRELY_04565 [Polyangiaceae bacterium]